MLTRQAANAGYRLKLKELTWLGFINSRTSTAAAGDYDTLLFSGVGTWSEDEKNLHVATSRLHVADAALREHPGRRRRDEDLNTRPVNRDTVVSNGDELARHFPEERRHVPIPDAADGGRVASCGRCSLS
jgi:hypothetical protein